MELEYILTKFNLQNLYAHTDKKNPNDKELLKNHLLKTVKYYYKYFDDDIIKRVIDNLVQNNKLSIQCKKIIYELFVISILLHDIGKINPKFQQEKMKNNLYKYKDDLKTTHHSWLSSIIYFNIGFEIINKKLNNINKKQYKRDKLYMINIIFYLSYIIAKHHSNLSDMDIDIFKDLLKRYYKDVQINKDYLIFYNDTISNINFKTIKNNIKYKNPFDIYIFIKLSYSYLVVSDIYATYNFVSKNEIDINIIDEYKLKQYTYKYQNDKIYKGIQKHKKSKYTYFKNNDINKLRSEIQLESESVLLHNLLNGLNSILYYLEAPTGSGKTLTSINLALNLLKHTKCNKLIYVFPFNTLIE